MAWRALGRSPDATWVDWAVARLEAGEDTEGVRVVAGLTSPFNYFETVALVDRALTQLGAANPHQEQAIHAYVDDLARDLLTVEDPGQTLREIGWLCIETDHDPALVDFYLLDFALRDLRTRGVQHYLPGIDRSNVMIRVLECARRWLRARGEPIP